MALAYLERYASSKEQLRRVLMRRVDRSAAMGEVDRAEAQGWVDELIGRLGTAGVVDDRTFALARAQTLARRGTSPRLIAARLIHAGVAGELIDEALAELAAQAGQHGDSARAAAVALARRRKLGPYRSEPGRSERRDKDLAALARAGFDLDTAREVIDAESQEDLEPGEG